MAFNVQIAFTGICAFVPNSDQGAAVKMCAVMLDGRGTESIEPDGFRSVDRLTSSFDAGKFLRRHQAFVTCQVRDLYGGKEFTEDLMGLWYLDRQRVTFKAEGGDNDFSDKMDTAADLPRIIPGYQFNPDIVSERPAGVVGHVLINRGLLVGSARRWSWVFPSTISQVPVTQEFSDAIFLNFYDLNRFALVMTPLESGRERVWEFMPPNGGSVTITIANLCDDNPLRWPRVRSELLPDQDFEWYYELLDGGEKARLLTNLLGLPLPIPYPVAGSSNGRGANCVPARTSSMAYDLSHLLPA